VQAVRLLTGQRRAGHTGTLDPFATGLLPICLGRATRLARFITGAFKTYQAVVRFGFATDTYDSTGRPQGKTQTHVCLDPEELADVLSSFVGEQEQVPPPFAAKKVNGQRMYRLARAGVPVEPKPVRVLIRRIDLRGVDRDRATLTVDAGSGTYIRSLAHDLGDRLGLGAHLEELRRTRIGSLSLKDAHTLRELETSRRQGRLSAMVLDPSEALCDFEAIRLGSVGARLIGHGRTVSRTELVGEIPELRKGQTVRILGPDDVFLAVGTTVDESPVFRPVVVFPFAADDSPKKRPCLSSPALHDRGPVV
jgi:tRNA pseudouridine55 synthase